MGSTRFRHVVALAMAVLISIFFQLPGATGSACHDVTTCGDCQSTLCHWCGSDQQCHAKGSIHGCVYGTYCYDNDQCQRTVPEYKGYAAPSIAVLLGVCLVGGTAIFFAMAILSIAREYANQSAASRANAAYPAPSAPPAGQSSADNRMGYMMLSGDDDIDGDIDRALSAEAEAEAGAKNKKKATASASGVDARRVRRRARGVGAPLASVPGPSPLARKVVGFTRFVVGMGIAAVLVCCTVVVMFAPHIPGVNVCNTKFDWGSIVQSLKKISVEADFQILVSVYNPNMLDAEIESGTAVIYHKHQQVGTMVFSPTLLSGGYVTDMLLTISFDGEAWEEAHIGWEYETGTLAFIMDATVSASVLFHGFKTYPFTFNINHYYIKVSDAVGYDRSLCNCTQMMQGQRPPYVAVPTIRDAADGDDGQSDDEQSIKFPLFGDDEARAVQQ